MEFTILLCIAFVTTVQAESVSTNYKIVHGKRADMDKISMKNSRSLTECAVSCTLTEGCGQVNYFTTSRCELLRRNSNESEIMFVDDTTATFLCEYVSLDGLEHRLPKRSNISVKRRRAHIFQTIQFPVIKSQKYTKKYIKTRHKFVAMCKIVEERYS